MINNSNSSMFARPAEMLRASPRTRAVPKAQPRAASAPEAIFINAPASANAGHTRPEAVGTSLQLFIDRSITSWGTLWTVTLGNPDASPMVFETLDEARTHALRIQENAHPAQGMRTYLRSDNGTRPRDNGWNRSDDPRQNRGPSAADVSARGSCGRVSRAFSALAAPVTVPLSSDASAMVGCNAAAELKNVFYE